MFKIKAVLFTIVCIFHLFFSSSSYATLNFIQHCVTWDYYSDGNYSFTDTECSFDILGDSQGPVTDPLANNTTRGNPGEGGTAPTDPVNGNESPAQCGKGNPILMATGNKVQPEVDYVGKGEFPLTVTRMYNHYSGHWGIYRKKWISNYGRSLKFVYPDANCGAFVPQEEKPWNCQSAGRTTGTPTEIYATRPGGAKLQFHYDSSKGFWVDNKPDPINKIVKNSNGTWSYFTEDNFVEEYAIAGNITKRTNPTGINHTYSYNGNNVSRVTHSSGRYLDFNWYAAKLNSITDNAGNSILYSSSGGKLSTVTLPGTPGITRQYIYGDSRFPDALTQINVNGKKYATFAYHSDSKGASTAHWANNSTQIELNQFTYTDNNTTVTNPLGHKTTYHFAEVNGVKKMTDVNRLYSPGCSAANSSTAYDTKGMIDKSVDWKGVETDYTYNDKGQLTSKTYARGTALEKTTDLTWIAGENRISKVQTTDSKLETTYTNSGRINSITRTNLSAIGVPNEARTTTYTYTNHSNGIISKLVINGPRTDVSDIVTYHYDTQGNLLTAVNALGHTTTYSNYDALGNAKRVTSPNGLIVDYTYDARGRVLNSKVYHPAGTQTTSFEYNSMGQVVKVTYPDGNYILTSYDQGYRKVRSTNKNGSYIDYALNANGNVISSKIMEEVTTYSIPPNCWGGGFIAMERSKFFTPIKAYGACEPTAITSIVNQKNSYFDYDAMGRLQARIGNGGQRTDYDYDNNSNIKEVADSYGRKTTMTHDELNRVKTSTNPDGKVTSYTYDAGGRVKTITDSRGLTTTYSYSGFGELEKLTSPDTGVTTYDYNQSGRVTKMVRNDGTVSTFTYDVLGRTKAENHGGLGKSYVYDSGTYRKGRLYYVNDYSGQTLYSYDKVGNITQKRSKVGGTYYYTSYTYDGMNRMTSMTYPSGRKALYYYDGLGRSNLINFQSGSTIKNVVGSFKYRPFGPVAEFSHGNGAIRKITHDLDYRPTNIFTSGIQSLNYIFDKNDNITKITNSYVSSNTQNYGYDVLNRLTSSSSTASGNQTYNYDEVGNRTKRYKNNALQDTNVYASSSNKLTSVNGQAITYNANGHTSNESGATFNYNAENRLSSYVKSGATTSFQHNALGQRVTKIKGSDSNRYFYDEAGKLVAEFSVNTNIWKEYIFLHGQVVGFSKNGVLYYVHNDHLGRAERLTNSSKSTVWRANNFDFDRTITTNQIGDYNLGFPGQYYDKEIGFYYNYFRDYNPKTGRYIQSDPIGLSAGVNTYAYVSGNPVNRMDPYGLEECACANLGSGHGSNNGQTNRVSITNASGAAMMSPLTSAGARGLNNSAIESTRTRHGYAIETAQIVIGGGVALLNPAVGLAIGTAINRAGNAYLSSMSSNDYQSGNTYVNFNHEHDGHPYTVQHILDAQGNYVGSRTLGLPSHCSTNQIRFGE